MDSLERCRILCGISEDNTKKLGLLSVLLEKAREDIEAFCRDTFIEAFTNDESITFDDPLPVSVEKKLYPYRQLFPRSYTLDDPVGGYKEG